MDTQSPLLSVKNLKTYFFLDEGVVKAVDGVSFDVFPGSGNSHFPNLVATVVASSAHALCPIECRVLKPNSTHYFNNVQYMCIN